MDNTEIIKTIEGIRAHRVMVDVDDGEADVLFKATLGQAMASIGRIVMSAQHDAATKAMTWLMHKFRHAARVSCADAAELRDEILSIEPAGDKPMTDPRRCAGLELYLYAAAKDFIRANGTIPEWWRDAVLGGYVNEAMIKAMERTCHTCGKLPRCPHPDGKGLCWEPREMTT